MVKTRQKETTSDHARFPTHNRISPTNGIGKFGELPGLNILNVEVTGGNIMVLAVISVLNKLGVKPHTILADP